MPTHPKITSAAQGKIGRDKEKEMVPDKNSISWMPEILISDLTNIETLD